MFFDKDSFVEYDRFAMHRCHNFGMETKKTYGDGVVGGHGMVNGRLTFAFSYDFTSLGGSLSETNAEKICKI